MWFSLPIQIKKMILQPRFLPPCIVEFGVFSSYGHPPLIEEALTTGEIYVGITHSEDQFKKLSAVYKNTHNISILYMRAPTLFSTGLADTSADLVIFSNSFHEFIQEKSLLTEVDRILKPGGTLAVAEFNVMKPEREAHFGNHQHVSKYEKTIIPLEESLGVSIELYQKHL